MTTRAAPRGAPTEVWRSVGSAAVAKVLVMAVTGLLGLCTTRIILDHFGVAAYAQYGLLSSLPSLLPFADLGIAAVLINAAAAAEDPRRNAELQRTVTSALRVLMAAGGVIAAVAIALTILDLWPVILGPGLLEGGNWVAGACLVVFGFTLPLTVGARLLVGLGRNTAQIATQALTAPVLLALVGTAAVLGAPAGQHLAIFAYIASTVVATTSLLLAARMVSPILARAARDVPRVVERPGVPVMQLAGPMLVQMLALPVAMQSARLIISHLGGAGQLAVYNLGSQLFGIALQTIAAAGVALWPVYARARAARRIDSPFIPTLWFTVGGLVIGAAMAGISPWIVGFVAGGALELDALLVGAFVLFIAVQAAKYPLGMYMTDARGLRFQVLPTIAMIPIAVGLSLWLIPLLGAAGSVLSVTAAVALCQLAPNAWFVQRDLQARRAVEAA